VNTHGLRTHAVARDVASVLALLAVTLVTRLPYFAVSVINWDESTFAILGQDLLDGHLPYTHLWDNKPPLVYVMFAFFIYLFGRSVTALRAGGVLCVWAASSILYLGVGRRWDRLAGWAAALVVIVACATLPSGQATMSEHLALVPLSLALISFLDGDVDGGRAFGCGLLLGLCVLVKADTALLAVGVAILVFADGGPRLLADRVRRVAWLALGTSAPILTTMAVYAVLGHLDILRITFLDASFAYVTLRSASRRWSIIPQILTNLLSPGASVFLFAIAGIALIVNNRPEWRRQALVLVAMSMALLAGGIVAGGGYGHYVLVQAPVVGVAAGLLVRAHRRRRVIVVGLLALVVIVSIGGSVRRFIGQIPEQGVTLHGDLPKRVARYLDSRHAAGQYVFLNTAHVAGWLSRVEHPSKFVHPSNLMRLALLRAVDGPSASVEGELRGILSKRPAFLVLSAGSLEGDDGDGARAAYWRTLVEATRTNYQLDLRDEDVLIYRRADLAPGG
jgi:4-amino-4-deoxy-L-arabinose transferase-like glycosyltransferase